MSTYPEPDHGQQGGSDGEINLLDILTQLLARKWLILLTGLVGLIIGWFIGQLPPDMFRAGSVIHIERRGQSIELPSELIGAQFGGTSGGGMTTESHIIRSRLILQPVAQQLNLDWLVTPERFPVIGHLVERRNIPGLPDSLMPQYVRQGDRIQLDLLEVDDPLIGRKARIEIIDDTTFTAALDADAPVTGKIGQDVQLRPGYRLRIGAIQAAPGRIFSIQRQMMLSTTSRLRSGLSIRERRGSTIVDFSYTSGDPDLSQRIVNTIVQTYQSQSLSRRSAEIDQSLSFLQEQIPQARLDVANAAETLGQFRKTHNVSELNGNSQTLLERATGIEAQLEELRFKEEELAQRLTPNHPDYRDLLLRRERLEKRLEELRGEAAGLPPLEQEFLLLNQALERAVEIEQQLVNRAEQLNILKASTVSNIRILEPAEFARKIGPNRNNPALMGGGGGLALGIFFILVLNFLRRGIDDSRVIERLGISLFATIDRLPELGGKSRRTNAFYAITRHAPSHVVAEAFRGLRTGLQFSLAMAPKKSLMITSPAPSMGKSFVSFNLALVAAQSGQKVLLVDADLRKGVLRKQFDLPGNHPGLSDLLAGNVGIDDVLVPEPETGLQFIPTGAYPPNPADILTSEAFRQFMLDAQEHFDLVIIDSPPVLAVTDPVIIGQHVGMNLLVVQHLRSTEEEIKSVQKMMDNAGVKLSGAILNQFDASASRYGTYGQKYGYYGGYSYKYD